ncbi:4-hydroxythreonine-4-phosphate dehydrogenase [Streptomyces oryzae]|uniref:4-hydroxythreonine-4-phosphate dehydrogenase n=1 Tax=Streptomyces oryzae TaxID=1434886 RepID=A0ABS3XK05_9ACTN|nr:4-hydroxythreonine-4-phosphate dehydrogenase [Streptomyces oryzae]
MALADDLSGAAEVAALLRLPARLVLDPSDLRTSQGTPQDHRAAVVADLDSRQAQGSTAAGAVRAALACADAARSPRHEPVLRYKKSDSLLRGNVGAEAVAFAEGATAVVVAMALPGAGRAVREGVLHVDGVPLHESAAWRAEGRTAPRSVAEALAPLPTAHVPLEAVRQRADGLAALLKDVAAQGRHPVCDAETDADLSAVAEAAVTLGPGYRLLGSGGLAAALGRHIGTGTPGQAADHEKGLDLGVNHVGNAADRGFDAAIDDGATAAPHPLLVVAGSAEPVVGAQIAQLVAAGARHLPLSPRSLAADEPVPLPPLASGTVTVISVDGTDGVRPDRARLLVAGLARTVAALPGRPDLVLTGGETARRVLDAVGISTLQPVAELHHGAVHSLTCDGRSVVTRPGSFGGPDSLHRIATALRPGLLSPPVPPPRPTAPASSLAPQPTPATATALPRQGVNR